MDEGDLQTEEPDARLLVDQLEPVAGQPVEVLGDAAHLVGHMVHALAALGEEPPDRGVLAGRREQLDERPWAGAKDDGLVVDDRPERPGVGVDRRPDVADGDADVVDPQGCDRHGCGCYQRAECDNTGLETDEGRLALGFLDKVKNVATESLEKGKELASEGLEKSQELAKTQQLKIELKKLEGQVEEAYAALGRKAFDGAEAGTLSADAVTADVQAVRDARAAAKAKQAEIDAVGAEAPAEAAADAPADAPAEAETSA